MSLPDHVWRSLNLSPRMVAARADYYESYLTRRTAAFSVNDLIGLVQDARRFEDARRVVRLSDQADPVAARLRQALERRTTEPHWTEIADAADASRQVAMARLLIDTGAGKAALRRSAEGYSRLDLAFGNFLYAAAYGLWPDPLDPLASDVRRSTMPAQQVARVLALVSDPLVVPDLGELVERLVAAPQSSGLSPVGCTGQPLAIWWAAAIALARINIGVPDAVDAIRAIVADLAYLHGQQLRHAQFDTFHWGNGNSGAELVDLYLAGLVALTSRVLRRAGYPVWRLDEDFGRLTPLAQVSLSVGIDLAEDDGDDTTASERPPLGEGPIRSEDSWWQRRG